MQNTLDRGSLAMSHENESKLRRQFVGSLLASTALVSAGATYAQSADPGVENEDERIEEIVVRGIARQFRPEDQTSATGINMKLIDTPQSVTVLTDEMLQTIGATSLYDAVDLVPGVVKNGYGFGLQQIIMRGIDNTNQRVNGMESAARDTSLEGYTVERIEVVRGPATVLYGVTGSFGGEINAVLKRPKAQPSFEAGFEFGSYDTQEYKFDLTGPIGGNESFRGRLVAKYDDTGLPYDIQNFDIRQEETTFLGSLAWDLTDRTTATVWYYHQEREGDAVDGGALVLLPDGNIALPTDVFDIDPDTWYFSDVRDSREDFSDDTFIAEVIHDFENDWTLRAGAMHSTLDFAASILYPFGPFGGYALADDQAYFYAYDVVRDNKELTFNLSLGGEFELFGRDAAFFAAYEYNDSLDPSRRIAPNSLGIGFIDLDLYADGVFDGVTPRFSDGTPIVNPDLDPDVVGLQFDEEEENTDHKVSFQLLARPFERVEVLVGALYHNNESRFRDFADDPITDQDRSFDEVLTRLGVTYDLVVDGTSVIDDARLFVSYSEGFEPQIASINGQARFIPQTMDAFEIGLKAELLDGAVGASVAYYINDIENIQTTGASLGSIAGLQPTQGTQENQGIEVEVVGEVLPGWNVAFNYAWYDGEISDDTLLDDGTLQFPYTAVPKTIPENSAVLATTYEFLKGPLSGLRLGGTFKYSSDYAFNDALRFLDRFTADDRTPQSLIAGGHNRLDLHASYEGFQGRLEGLRLHFNWINVTDEEILVQKQNLPQLGIMFIDREFIKAGFTYSF